jgi:hypothetical protein
LWIETQIQKRRALPDPSQPWKEGTTFLFRGEMVTLHIAHETNCVCFGGIELPLKADAEAEPETDLRALIERHLRQLAEAELAPRVMQMAQVHKLTVRRVTIRSQKSRWGSCSARGTISLNWRLIQTPSFVCEYIIIHELMHLRQMNHSIRFWREVAAAFPAFRAAEQWLKSNASLIR